MCSLCVIENADEGRKESKTNLENRPKKVIMNSDKKCPLSSLGVTNRVPIPEVDKRTADSLTVLTVIIKVSEDGFYQL